MIKRLVPKAYRPLLDYISPAAFKVIDWKSAVSRFAKQFGATPEIHIQSWLPNVEVIDTLRGNRVEGNDERLDVLILELYFGQFYSAEPIYLDLRRRNFYQETSPEPKDSYLWKPSGLIETFDESFRKGMLDIYEGYYLDNPAQLEKGLFAVGLVSQHDQVEETTQLLFSHFGSGDQRSVHFDLKKFHDSFHDLFIHIKKHDLQLSSDFLFLGVYLVTLYTALNGRTVNVRDSFLKTAKRFHSQDD